MTKLAHSLLAAAVLAVKVLAETDGRLVAVGRTGDREAIKRELITRSKTRSAAPVQSVILGLLEFKGRNFAPDEEMIEGVQHFLSSSRPEFENPFILREESKTIGLMLGALRVRMAPPAVELKALEV